MPIYDYSCDECNHEEPDLYFTLKNLPKVRTCGACGAKKSTQHFAGVKRLAQITSGSSMYGVEQPCVGVTFNSYEEKVKYLKENNLIETNDPVGGSRYKGQEPPPKPRQSADWVSEPEEALM